MTNKNKLFRYGSWLAVLIWLIIIFQFSAQHVEESSELSMKVAERIANTVEVATPHVELQLEHFHHVIRKNAHFFIYLVLGILMMNAFVRSLRFNIGLILLTFGICFLYAISDEIHQLFVPGRGGQIRDVIIDSSGSLIGIGLFLLVRLIVIRTNIRSISLK